MKSLLKLTMLFFIVSACKNTASLDPSIKIYKPDRIAPGLNLYNTRHDTTVKLIDNRGRIKHSWDLSKSEQGKLWGIHYSIVDPDGNLYAIVQARELIKVSKDSKFLWLKQFNAHHDIQFDKEKNLIVPVLKTRTIEVLGVEREIFIDEIVILNPGGEIIKEISLDQILMPYLDDLNVREKIALIEEEQKDLFHVNKIQVIENEIPEVANKGDYLISIRNFNELIVIDSEAKQIKWRWGKDVLEQMHQANFTKDHNLIVFDNGVKRKFSRVLEIDPKTKEIIRSVEYENGKRFFSKRIAGAQKLENDNYLVTVGRAGFVFEIDSFGKTIWKFVNPEFNKDGKSAGYIFFMKRYPEDYFNTAFLNP